MFQTAREPYNMSAERPAEPEDTSMTIAVALDAETENLACRLAEVTGKPLPTVVKDAIEASAVAAGVRLGPPAQYLTSDELLAKMIEITNRISQLPVLDPRSADEIIGYDENGLPK